MKIVIDMQGAQTLQSSDRGVGRYTMEMTKNLISLAYPKHDIVLFLNNTYSKKAEEIKKFFKNILPDSNIYCWNQRKENTFFANRPEHLCENSYIRYEHEIERENLLENLNPDIIWLPNPEEGMDEQAITSVKRKNFDVIWATSQLDVASFMYSKYLLTNPAVQYYLNEKMLHTKNSDIVITISNFSKNKIKELFKIEEKKIFSIYLSCDKNKFKPNIDIYNKQKYILYVSAYRPYTKNLESLINAFEAMSEELKKNYNFYIIGKNLKKYISYKENKNIIFLDYVTDDELISYYKNCSLFVLPSIVEGFGLSLLEAMSCGAPSLCSNTSSLPEIAELSEMMFNPYNVTEMSKMMEKTLLDDNFKKKLIDHGLNQSKKFDWMKSAKEMLNIFEKEFEKKIKDKNDMAQIKEYINIQKDKV